MPVNFSDLTSAAVLSEDARQICFLVRCLEELRSKDSRSSVSDRQKMQAKLNRLEALICTEINQLQGSKHHAI